MSKYKNVQEILKAHNIDESDFTKDLIEFSNEREQVLEKYIKEHEQLMLIMDNSPCTISWIKQDRTYGGVNKSLAHLVGMEPEDFVGKELGFYTKGSFFSDFVNEMHEQDDPAIYKNLETYIDGQKKTYWVCGAKMNARDESIVIGIDITEYKNMEAMLTLKEKLSALGEMVADIIHEINNPLMSIRANAKKIERSIESNDLDTIKERTERITKTVTIVDKLIKCIKSFVRTGEQDPFEQHSLVEIVEDAFMICEGRLKSRGIRVEKNYNELNPVLDCNQTRMFQVFVNLITNSIDAIQDLDDKWVKISFEDAGDSTKVIFKDSGSGIPENIASKLFEQYFTTKGVGKGTGIGLSLCQKIMNEHGGAISINQSEKHTTFVLELPKHKALAA